MLLAKVGFRLNRCHSGVWSRLLRGGVKSLALNLIDHLPMSLHQVSLSLRLHGIQKETLIVESHHYKVALASNVIGDNNLFAGEELTLLQEP
jgi:hypothetical protein